MKHPGPWSFGGAPGEVTDAEGGTVLLPSDAATGQSAFCDLEAERLILSAPELLAELKMHVLARRDQGDESAGLRHSEALIDRIEKGEG